jgi:hypothetical protein
MVFAFLAIWTFGAVLLLTCSALMWSERISVLRTVPVCARCGYELTGLSRSAACPECAARERRFTAPGVDAARSRASVGLWLTPTLIGLIVSGAISVLAHIPTPWNVFGVALNSLAFVACAVLLRVLLKWITRTAAMVMMWCCIVALSASLAAAVLYAASGPNLSATPDQVLLLGPLLTIPFAGYGLAGGIVLLSLWRGRRAGPLPPPKPAALPPMPPPRMWKSWRAPR